MLWIALFATLLVVPLLGVLFRQGWHRFWIAMLWTLGLVGAAIAIARLSGCGDDPARPELADELVDGHRMLRHPSGLELRHPGADYVRSDAIAHEFEPALGGYCYAYVSDAAHLGVCFYDTELDTRAHFAAQITRLRKDVSEAVAPGGLTASFLAVPPGSRDGLATLEAMNAALPHTLEDRDSWPDRTAQLHVEIRGVHLRVKLVAFDDGFAVAHGVSRDPDALADVLASFQRRR